MEFWSLEFPIVFDRQSKGAALSSPYPNHMLTNHALTCRTIPRQVSPDHGPPRYAPPLPQSSYPALNRILHMRMSRLVTWNAQCFEGKENGIGIVPDAPYLAAPSQRTNLTRPSLTCPYLTTTTGVIATWVLYQKKHFSAIGSGKTLLSIVNCISALARVTGSAKRLDILDVTCATLAKGDDMIRRERICRATAKANIAISSTQVCPLFSSKKAPVPALSCAPPLFDCHFARFVLTGPALMICLSFCFLFSLPFRSIKPQTLFCPRRDAFGDECIWLGINILNQREEALFKRRRKTMPHSRTSMKIAPKVCTCVLAEGTRVDLGGWYESARLTHIHWTKQNACAITRFPQHGYYSIGMPQTQGIQA